MKIVKIFFQLSVMLLFFFTAFLLISSKTNKIAGIRSFVVLTGSMQPTFAPGSIIFTQTDAKYHEGDIISFQLQDVVVTHRVVKQIDASNFITKGDTNKVADKKTVSSRDILGKEFVTIPYLGSLLLFLKTSIGFVMFIIVPALLFIISELFVIKVELEKEIENKLINKISLS